MDFDRFMQDPTLNQNLESDEIHHGNFDRDLDQVY